MTDTKGVLIMKQISSVDYLCFLNSAMFLIQFGIKVRLHYMALSTTPDHYANTHLKLAHFCLYHWLFCKDGDRRGGCSVCDDMCNALTFVGVTIIVEQRILILAFAE